MSYTPSYDPEYTTWQDYPVETTPVIARALNKIDDAIENIEDYLADNDIAGSIGDLSDVDLTGLQNGNTLIYDNGAHKFKPGNAGSGGANRFVDLNDVTITDPTNGEPIVYQDGMFVNGDISVARIYYGTCASLADVQHKVVTIPSAQQFKLKVGAIIFVKFSYTNQFSATANDHITLNVNSTGDKPIYAGNTGALTGINITYYGRKDFVNQYVYDGTYWVWCGSSADNNSVYVNREALSGGVQTSLVTTGDKYNWDHKADPEDIPTKLSDLEDDSTHRLVTDAEKTTWNAKAEVEANPSGAATDTLEKVDIDGTIYGLQDATKADQDSIAYVENGTTSTHEYAIDEFFYRNGDFCIATNFIQIGDTLTENTNYTVTKVSNHIGVNSGRHKIFYGTCNTAASARQKEVTVSSDQDFYLDTGVVVFVTFDNTNTYEADASNPVTLNVNSSGSNNIKYGSSSVPTGTNTTAFGRANYTNCYVFDGTYWVWQGSSADNNTTYQNRAEAQGGTQTSLVTTGDKYTWNRKVSDNPTFTEASTRANITSGESFATILGKIKKYFTDLKAVAFSGSYNDLSNKPTIPTVPDIVDNLTTDDATKVLSAKQGKVLQDTKVNISDIKDNLTSTDTNKPLSAKQGKVLNEKIDGLYTEVTDTEPYVLRQGKGDMVDMELVGGSLAWNQLVQNGNFATTDNWSTTRATLTVSGNVGTLTVTDASNWQGIVQSQTISGTSGHKVLVSVDMKATTSNAVKMGVSLNATTLNTNKAFDVSVTSSWQRKATVIQTTADITGTRIVVNGTPRFAVNDTLDIRNVNVFDLTQKFGSTIADYIYSLEQATSGSGVAWFRQYFPKAYYAYNTGSIQSVCVSARKVVGKNLFDEVYPNISGTTQFRAINVGSGNFTLSTNMGRNDTYGANLFLLAGNVSTGASTANNGVWNTQRRTVTAIDGYITIGYRNQDNVDPRNHHTLLEKGSTVTTYEPYTTTTYPMPTTQLRGIPTLVDGKLAFDGDVLKSSGLGSAKYKLYHLYDYTWTYESSEQTFYTTGITDFKLPTNNATPIKGICGKYFLTDRTTLYNGLNKSIAGALNGRIWVKDTSYSDATQFKNSLNGVYLVAELATPTAISASPYQNPQRADANGTEEFVDYGVEQSTRDVAIPCGHNSTYTSADVIQPIEDYVDNAIATAFENDGWEFVYSSSVTSNSSGLVPSVADPYSAKDYSTGYEIKILSDKSGVSVSGITVQRGAYPVMSGCTFMINFNAYIADTTINYKVYAREISETSNYYEVAIVKQS